MSLDGKPVALGDLQGKVVLLNVWATWCVPCRAEMPGLQGLHEEFQDKGFEMIGVSIDDRGADSRIGTFLDSLDVTYNIWRDPDDRFAPTFKTIGVPESFLISTDGYILYQWKGAFDPLSEDTKSRVKAAIDVGNVGFIGSSGTGSEVQALTGAFNAPTVVFGIKFSAGL